VIAANVSEKTFIGKEELEKNQEQYWMCRNEWEEVEVEKSQWKWK
jgi:hypothetical protein